VGLADQIDTSFLGNTNATLSLWSAFSAQGSPLFHHNTTLATLWSDSQLIALHSRKYVHTLQSPQWRFTVLLLCCFWLDVITVIINSTHAFTPGMAPHSFVDLRKLQFSRCIKLIRMGDDHCHIANSPCYVLTLSPPYTFHKNSPCIFMACRNLDVHPHGVSVLHLYLQCVRGKSSAIKLIALHSRPQLSIHTSLWLRTPSYQSFSSRCCVMV